MNIRPLHPQRMLRLLTNCLVIGQLMTCHAIALAASSFQSLTLIQEAAENHVRKLLPHDGLKRMVKADRLDERLRLATCLNDLEVFLPSGANLGARTTTAVRCPGTSGWTLYLPVNISTETPTLISVRPIARGAELSALDVQVQLKTSAGLGDVNLSSPSQIADLQAKRDIAPGTLLTQAMVTPKLLIKRGQQVTLLASMGGIEVRSQGVALTDGSANSRIRVKNLNSAKVVEGLVDSSQLVRVLL